MTIYKRPSTRPLPVSRTPPRCPCASERWVPSPPASVPPTATGDKAAAGPRTAAIPVMSTGLMAANGPRCLQFGPRLFRQLSRQPSSSAVFREDVLTEVNQRSRLDSTDVHRCRRYRRVPFTVQQLFVVSFYSLPYLPSSLLDLWKEWLEEMKQKCYLCLWVMCLPTN